MPRYAGPATFARLPRTDEVTHTDVAVVGVPFDSGVSYRPGRAVRPRATSAQSSKLLRPYHPRLDVEPFAVQQVADAGDIAVNPFDIAEAITTIERASDELRDGGTKLITLGGDHTIALPLLRSLHRDHGPIAVLHFDAHLDTWDTYFGAPFTHGTPFRRASEEGLLDPEHCLHVGIRGPLYASTDLSDDRVLGFQVIGTDDVQFDGLPAVIERMRARLGDAPVYVSDRHRRARPGACARHRHPGGRRHDQPRAAALPAKPGRASNVVGADIVEVAPAYDHAEITGIAAAHVAYELLSVLAAKRMTGHRNGGAAVVETLAATRRRHHLRHPRHPQPGAVPALRRRPASARSRPATSRARATRPRPMPASAGGRASWSPPAARA